MDYRETTCSAEIRDKIFLGGCFQNDQPQADNVLVFVNTTSPTPVPLPADRNGGGSCDCTIEWNSTARGINWASAYCGGQEYWQTQSLNQDMLTVQTFQTGSVINLGRCLNMGMKPVAAQRFWHGCLGWNNQDPCGESRSLAPSQTKYRSVTAECSYNYHSDNSDGGTYVNTIGGGSGTRIVGANTGIISSSFYTYEDAHEVDYAGTTDNYFYHAAGGAGFSLDPFTGLPVSHSSGMTTQADVVLGLDAHCCNSVTLPSDGIFGGGTIMQFVENWLAGLITPLGFNTDGHFVSSSIPAITDCANYSATASDSYDRFDPDTGTTFTSTYSLAVSWSTTETGYSFSLSYSTSITGTGGTWMGHGTNDTWSFSGTLTLGDVNTSSDIEADRVTLLSYWPLNNNAIYPWRSADSYTMFMPKVSRREVGSNVSPIGFNPYTMDDRTSPITDGSGSILGYNQILWKDPNSYYWISPSGSDGTVASAMGDTHFDGEILGKPFLVNTTASTITGNPPSDGNGSSQGTGWFDFYTNDVRFCKTPVDIDCGTSPPYQMEVYRRGGTLADFEISVPGATEGAQFINFLPQCATHWVNNYEAHSIPKGASVSCNLNTLGGTWTVKYAECRPRYGSYNFFRPCGPDRWAIDEDTATCFQDDLVLRDPLTNISGAILLAFTNGYDGIYVSSSQALRGDGDYDLTLGTKIRDLPGDFYHPFADQFRDNDILGNFGLAGVIRFPNAFGICGRDAVIISGSSDGTGSLITFADAQVNLYTDDKITLFNNAMTAILTASLFKLDNNNFTCSISHTGSITASRWAMSVGAPDYHWQDTTEKLQYRWGVWDWNNRNDVTSSATYDSCIHSSPCAESVVCFSPNASDTFPNGATYWFSGSTQYDDAYGSMRQMNVEFAMIDPLYQQPKKPCNFNHLISPQYAQDDGTCLDDGADDMGNPIIRYPPPPFVEAMVSMPSGSPALPLGLSWPPMNRPNIPGTLGFSFAVPTQPWTIRANELDQCENNPSCRWLTFYNC